VYPCGDVWLTGTHVWGSDKCGPSQAMGALNARSEGDEAEEKTTLPEVSSERGSGHGEALEASN